MPRDLSPVRPHPQLGVALLALLLGLAACRHAAPPVTYAPPPAADLELAFAPYPSTKARPVLAHYMAWFRWRQGQAGIQQDHWGWGGEPGHDPLQVDADGRRDVASVYIPRIGPYDSQDPAVLDYHILSAKAAGISGFIVDWYSPGDNVDQSLQQLFRRAEALDFQVAICLEEKTCFPEWAPVSSRAEAVALMQGKLRYVLETYADSAAIWRLDGRIPVLLFAGWDSSPGIGERKFTAAEWETIRAVMPRQDWTLVLQNFDSDHGGDVAGFAWVGDAAYRDWFHRTADAMVAADDLAYAIGGANPGFDSRGTWGWGHGPTVTDRESGGLYQAWFQAAAASAVDAVQIVTWNDFAEGTVIEPTREFGRGYLDLTERHIGAMNGRPVDLDDNELPYRWYCVQQALRAATPLPDLPPVERWLARGQTRRASAAIDRLVSHHGLVLPALIDAAREYPPLRIPRALTAAETALFRRLAGRENRLQGASATANSHEAPGYSAAAAVDGDAQTRWASSHANGQSLTITATRSLQRGDLVMVWETAHAAQVTVQVSADGETWQTVGDYAVDSPAPMTVPIATDAPFRHLRLTFPTRATKWGVSLWEVGYYD